jgi:hypothetical protein
MGTSSSKGRSAAKPSVVSNPSGQAGGDEDIDEDHVGIIGDVKVGGAEDEDEEGSSSDEEVGQEEEEEEEEDGKESLEAKIVHYMVVQNVIKYTIRVKRREGSEIVSSWVVHKRYTEFERLVSMLKQLDGRWKDLKPPPKHNTAPTVQRRKPTLSGVAVDRNFLDERKKQLQALLNTLVAGSTEQSCPVLLRDFLEMAKVHSSGYEALITDMVIDDDDDVVKYNIRVSNGADESASAWVVQKRFSDFEKLLTSLKAIGDPWSCIRLPRKINMKGSSRDIKFLLKRKTKLQNILDFLITTTDGNVEKGPAFLWEFFQSGRLDTSSGEAVE